MTMAAAACRTIVILFWLATSAYAFLISVPFVYEQFLQPGLVPALVTFVRWHGVMAMVCAALAGVALWPEIAGRRAVVSGSALLWLLSMAGVGTLVAAPLMTAQPGTGALALSAAALLPVVWFGVIDFANAPWPDSDRASDLAARDLVVAMVGALAVATLFAVQGVVVTRSFGWLGGVLAITSHALLFAAVFAAFAIARAVADMTSKPAQWEGLAGTVMLAVFMGLAAALVVLPAVSVADRLSRGVVVAFGATTAFVLAARGLRSGRASDLDSIARVMSGLLPAWAHGPRVAQRAAWIGVLVACAVAFRAVSLSMDWNFALAKIGAVVLWFLVLATAVQWVPARVYLPQWLPFAVCLGVLTTHLFAAGRLPFGPVTAEAATTAGDTWAIGDPSFRTLRDWTNRPVPQVETATSEAADDGGTFFDYLQANTNIGRSIPVNPVPVILAPLNGPPAANRPHVFVFVIDSLRRDYVAPYNSKVGFTPAIAQFGAESTVFERAFTRYGATGLSVPSIWVGGMLLHKQYVTPFAPMNALHALLAQQQYARVMSMDNILEIIMPRDGSLSELDKQRGVGDFRLCSTLDELRGRLDAINTSHTPTFVWSLPQDVHVAVLNREGNAPVDGQAYDGFFAPYASRVRRLDQCFGTFVTELKARGMYDDSLIVLTADHGDSLGEEGRWGHAYTLYPEVVQVPLIMHLPKSLRGSVTSDPTAPAFTTDITPTLYSLLGHTPTTTAPIFGTPLYWPTQAPRPARPTFGLLASSYGSVYAWLDAEGREMYIADGVALRDYVYTLDGTPAGVAHTVSAEARAHGQRAIRAAVGDIASFYKFTPPSR